MQTFGLASETFIRDAIAEVASLGWTPWVITEARIDGADAIPPERIVKTPSTLPLVDRVAVRTPIARVKDPLWARSSHKYLTAVAKAPPGILHAHFGWVGAYCALAARKLSLPLLVSFHGTDLTVSANDPVWREPYAMMLRQAGCVTLVSRFLEGRLRSLGYEGPAEIVPSGVRLKKFPFSGAPRPGEAPRILFIGRLIDCKGVDTLIEALARTHAHGVHATLRIVGDGPLRAQVEERARALGVSRAVEFVGTRSHAEVREELERSDIVAVPSRPMADGQEEGSSVVSKEAQAIGVPVVATNVGGIPETLPPEFRHELVPPDQPDALAARISQLWSEREQWPARTRRQREWVEFEFAWEKLASRLSAIYESLLLQHPPGRARLPRLLRSRRPGNSRSLLR